MDLGYSLQAGIQPSWSDQNEGRKAQPELRQIDAATAEQRRLAALEWLGKPTEVPPEARQEPFNTSTSA